ncbi:hypothetical protein [Microbacterium sp. MPKO10]|uniref:hypothetical protein n=1 Tax=Microbacterium sp. MPKO10 TaxID=2989818 RepID=UPI0022366183|nr:hypothetical protein [Microbacterium sp. MPKO10]MCW4458601.1 hypothetical protein [Microbacterium sp. MPKO10]
MGTWAAPVVALAAATPAAAASAAEAWEIDVTSARWSPITTGQFWLEIWADVYYQGANSDPAPPNASAVLGGIMMSTPTSKLWYPDISGGYLNVQFLTKADAIADLSYTLTIGSQVVTGTLTEEAP